ncbi:alpha/beta-hydrolase, partial [Jaminaea rosea]
TVLPTHIAEAITGLSIVARVSLRATAFFLEVILEATKFGTGIGMGLTRRALIGAIGAARTMHALTPGSDDDKLLGPADGLNSALLSILDRYTAAGIYVVHHTLTMTELMAMSGLCLVQDSIKTGVAVAEESVRLIDGVFGSNETSRALSKFIELVKRESDRGDGGGVAINTVKTFAAITRALTTFAVVRAATHRRTAKQHKMKVIYDYPSATTATPQAEASCSFPRRPLIHNLHRFGRFASACYGVHFLNILGLSRPSEPYMFRNTPNTHANVWAFAHHVGVHVHDVALSSYCADAVGEQAFFHSHRLTPIVNFVVVDHESEAVVLACRGTLGLSDVLVDLTCDYEQVTCEAGEGYVHGGIWESSRRLATNKGTLKTTLRECLERNPTYGLVTVGHSLGGGVAALLAMQWATPSETTAFVTSVSSGLPAGRPIHSFTYGPAAVTDADLSASLRGLVTSMVHGNDVVPCFSLGLVRDMRDIGVVLEQATGEGATEILGRTIGLYQRRRKAEDIAADDDETSDWLWSLIKTMRAHASNDKLYPPGEVYVAETTTAHRVILRSCPKVQERFSEPIFSRSLFRDHSPSNYE